MSKLQGRRRHGQNWDLELGISLVFGAWCLDLGVWDLVFRPVGPPDSYGGFQWPSPGLRVRVIVIVPLASRLGSFFDPFPLFPVTDMSIAEKDVGTSTVAVAWQLRIVVRDRL